MQKSQIATLVLSFIACFGKGIQAQGSVDLPMLLRQLQVPETTDRATEQLLKLGKADPEAKKYLASQLPPIIEKGATNSDHSWTNAVRLAGELKIAQAAPALAKWVGLDNSGAVTLAQTLRLETDPAGKALSQIGDPSLPALAAILKSDNIQQRTGAIYVLRLIGTPAAKKALEDQMHREPDPGLRAFIERILAQ